MFIKLKRTEAISGLKKTAIYEGVKKKTFPAPVKLGERSSAWVESEVIAWCEQRIAESRKSEAA